MATRKYPFALPVHLSGIQASGAISILEQDHIWERLPPSLQAKLTNSSFWSGVDIDKSDLDKIDNKTYNLLTAELKRHGVI